jgi:CubicO group peptidase (beta-lactamase class C family)
MRKPVARLSAIVAFVALWALAPLPAQTVADRYEQKLRPALDRVIREQQLPGLAIAVVERGRVAYASGFGVRNLGRPAEAITTRSLFHMASITKPFVATSLMQLVESGRVDLDAPVVKYLPYFRMADERFAGITVRQMVTHTSGMPDVADYEWDKPQYDAGALERYVRSLTSFRLEFQPGARFKYSNMAFEILGDLVSKMSGETFDDYVQRHILAPLAMKDSTLLVRQADPGLLAWGHERGADGRVFPSKVYPYNRMHTPSSNLHSNASDMARWAMANMNRGELDGAKILRASTYDLMWKPAAEFGGRPSPTGISWFVSTYRGHLLVEHGGGDTGFRTALTMLPDQKVAVVWMTNADWLRNGVAISHAALDVALGLEPAP